MLRELVRIVFVVVLAASASTCHQCAGGVGPRGDLVGGPCDHDRHCADECLEGPAFPGGTCSVECFGDEDCPDETRCVAYAIGYCLLECDHDSNCRNGYDCRLWPRFGELGTTEVCIDD